MTRLVLLVLRLLYPDLGLLPDFCAFNPAVRPRDAARRQRAALLTVAPRPEAGGDEAPLAA